MKRENEERHARCPFRRYRNGRMERKKEQAKIETMRNGVRGKKPGGKIRKRKRKILGRRRDRNALEIQGKKYM